MAKIEEAVWTTEDSENLYRVKLWGDNYFAVNDEGNLSVRPILGDPIAIDIHKVVKDLKSQRVEFPLLIRFQDLLRSRVTELNDYLFIPLFGSTWNLPETVGLDAAIDLLLWGARWSAGQARQNGLVDEVVAPEGIRDRIGSFVDGVLRRTQPSRRREQPAPEPQREGQSAAARTAGAGAGEKGAFAATTAPTRRPAARVQGRPRTAADLASGLARHADRDPQRGDERLAIGIRQTRLRHVRQRRRRPVSH